MTDIKHSAWQRLDDTLMIYRYKPVTGRLILSAYPILLVHGAMTSHHTWDYLAMALAHEGCSEIYAVDIADIQAGGSLRQSTQYLQDVVEFILSQFDAGQQMILVGHSTGGTLVRRYLLKAGAVSPVILAFTLASPHTRTYFPHQVFLPPEQEDTLDPDAALIGIVKTPEIAQQTFLINIFGDAIGNNFDGTVTGVYLPEAINYVLPLEHGRLKYDRMVVQEILAWLKGDRYRMQFFLHRMQMREDDGDGMAGPFYFEVNGTRSPYQGSFLAEVDRPYSFETTNTPLATLMVPARKRTFVSTVFRLRDQSRGRSVRRRLMVKLFQSVNETGSVIHAMQDSAGSNIDLRIHIQKMPPLVRANHE